jgi:hypothetical protein
MIMSGIGEGRCMGLVDGKMIMVGLFVPFNSIHPSHDLFTPFHLSMLLAILYADSS